MANKARPIKSNWATRNKQFKEVERLKNPAGDTVYGRLRIGNDYYRVTESMGNYIMKYSRELNMRRKMGLISDAEFQSYKHSLIRDLSDKNVRNIGHTGVMLNNFLVRGGISDKLFSPKIMAQMSDEQKEIVKQFKKNIKAMEKDLVLAEQVYDEVSEYFGGTTAAYKLYQEQGGTLTPEQIDDMVENIRIINNTYSNEFKNHRAKLR